MVQQNDLSAKAQGIEEELSEQAGEQGGLGVLPVNTAGGQWAQCPGL